MEDPLGVSRGGASIELDGQVFAMSLASIPLADDGGTHQIRVVLG